jgi:DNA-binding response OmpR family regulator
MRVLILDDDRDFLHNILPGVEKEFVIDVAYCSEEGEYLCTVNEYDSYIISHKYFQASPNFQNYPNVLVLAENQCVGQKTKILDLGADVVMDKLTDASEISAQVRALLRRKSSNCSLLKLHYVDISLDLERKELLINSQRISLRRKEYQLLEYLFINRNKIVSESELLEHIWNEGACLLSNTVAVHIRTIRSRIAQLGGPQIIETIKNLGYVVKDV